MQDRKLLELAARHAASKILDDTSYEKQEQLYEKLQERATAILDKAFRLLPDIACPGTEKPQFADIKAYDATWSGEQTISVVQNGQYHQEITRRWLRLDILADERYKRCLNDQKCFYVMKRLLVGAYDIRDSSDGGLTWSDPARSEKLEIITGLYTMPVSTVLPEDLDDDRESYDPFHDGPFILERFDPSSDMGCNSQVFTSDELEANGFITPPDLQHYPTPQALFKEMDAALDEFDCLLEGAELDDLADLLCEPA